MFSQSLAYLKHYNVKHTILPLICPAEFAGVHLIFPYGVIHLKRCVNFPHRPNNLTVF